MKPPTDLVAAIARWAVEDPARAAIRDRRGHVTTYADVVTGAGAVRDDLLGHGLAPGDGVLLAIRPSARAVMAALGVVLARGVVVVADPGAGEALARLRRDVVPARAAVADTVVHAATAPAPARVLRRVPATADLRLPDLSTPGLHHIVSGPRLPGVPAGATRWADLPAGGPWPTPLDAADDALVVFTSGSTGDPRAVVHTVGSLTSGCLTAGAVLGFDEVTVMHTDQLMIGLPVLAAGGHWSLPPVTASTRGWVRQARAAGATHAYAVPAKLVAAAVAGLPASLSWLGTGGAPVLPAAVRRIRREAPGVELVAVYGMTEALPVAVASAEQVLSSPADLVSVGEPVPGTTVRIDAEPGQEIGEVVVSGPQVRDRYAGHEPDPEVRTGDEGMLSDDGTLLLAGRRKNMIIRGQANIYPELVEPLLLATHPQLADCALVGLPDPVTGDEEVVLAVVPTPGVDPRRLAREVIDTWPLVADAAWRPDRVIRVASIPRRGRSGAVDHAALRTTLANPNRPTRPTPTLPTSPQLGSCEHPNPVNNLPIGKL